MRPSRPALLALLVLCCAAPRPAAARVISRNAEISVGRETASAVEKYYRVDTDPVAVARVRQIGRRLAACASDADFPFEFHVVDANDINAFALPGGFVYVYRGLLQLVPNDDALAFIMGHEISHVTRRHAVRQFEKSFLLSAGITGVLLGTGAVAYGDVANVVQELVGLKFSRLDESEADTLGIELMAHAGYNPRAAADAMTLIKRAEPHGSPEPALFRSHPTTEGRIRKLTDMGNAIVARRVTERPKPADLPPAPKPPMARLEGLGDERIGPCEWLPLASGARWSYRTENDPGAGGMEIRVLERVEAEPGGVFRVEYTLDRDVKSVRLVAPLGERLVSHGEAKGAPPAWRLDALFTGEESLDGGEKLRFGGTETIKVPAGEFPAARVERLGADGKPVSVSWYARGVGLIRRLDPVTGAAQVLTAYSLPSAAH